MVGIYSSDLKFWRASECGLEDFVADVTGSSRVGRHFT